LVGFREFQRLVEPLTDERMPRPIQLAACESLYVTLPAGHGCPQVLERRDRTGIVEFLTQYGPRVESNRRAFARDPDGFVAALLESMVPEAPAWRRAEADFVRRTMLP
jgi:hypothetical protein